MNSSGKAVQKLVNYYKVKMSDLWVIHDDLDIILGQYKIQKDKGPKLHNGVESIEKFLGKTDFWRVRVGVDNRSGNRKISGEDYVLQKSQDKERTDLEKVVEKIVDDLSEKFNL